jgi:tetratricopeptide (TPR) repeat protein
MKRYLIGIITFLTLIPCAYALDWKPLHEQADTLDSKGAFALSQPQGATAAQRYVLALVYLNEHKDIEAGAVFAQLRLEDPVEPAYQWGAAEVLRRQYKLAESEQILSAILKEHDTFAPACNSLAFIRYNRLDFQGAIQLAQKVLDAGSDKVDLSNKVRAYLMIAGSKGMLAHYGGPLAKLISGTQVLPLLKKTEKLHPNDPAVLFGVGSYYFLAPGIVGGDRDKAMWYMQRAIDVDPLFADAYVRLAQLYKMKGNLKKYEELLQKVQAIDPGNILARDARTGECKFICVGLEK